jgi:hypothetical protein
MKPTLKASVLVGGRVGRRCQSISNRRRRVGVVRLVLLVLLFDSKDMNGLKQSHLWFPKMHGIHMCGSGIAAASILGDKLNMCPIQAGKIVMNPGQKRISERVVIHRNVLHQRGTLCADMRVFDFGKTIGRRIS